MSATGDDRHAKVDQQDGGPGSHVENGGEENDVASGGVSQPARTHHDNTEDHTDSESPRHTRDTRDTDDDSPS